MADADTKAEIKKAILELQSLASELNSALEQTSAKVDANNPVSSDLRDLYERFRARSDEILAQLDRLQNSLSVLGPK